MRLGMFMHPIHDFRRGYHTLLFEDLDVIRAADAEGFDEVWLGEHFLLPSEPFADPADDLRPPRGRVPGASPSARRPSACPTSTRRSSPAAPPSSTTWSKGRFMMGVGPGAAPPDFELFGVLDKNRMEMLEESVDMMIKLWTTDPPYDIRRQVLAGRGQGQRPAGHRRRQDDRALPEAAPADHAALDEPQLGRARLAARRGWDMISANFVPGGGADRPLARLLRRAAEARPAARAAEVARRPHAARHRDRRGGAGLPAARPATRSSGISSTSSASRATAASSHMLKSDPDMPDSEVTPQYCIDTIVIAGSPRTVAERWPRSARRRARSRP